MMQWWADFVTLGARGRSDVDVGAEMGAAEVPTPIDAVALLIH